MAIYPVGKGYQFETLADIAGDPVNSAGNGCVLTDPLYLLDDETLTFDPEFTIQGAPFDFTGCGIGTGVHRTIVDASKVTSGTAIVGGDWRETVIVCYNGTLSKIFNSSTINMVTVNAPLISSPLDNCSGSRNAINTIDGVVSGLPVDDSNIWSINSTAGDYYEIPKPAKYFDGVDDNIDCGNAAELDISTGDLRIFVRFSHILSKSNSFQNPLASKFVSSSTGWYLGVNDNDFIWRSYGTVVTTDAINFSDGKEHTIEVVQIGSDAVVSIDGGEEVFNLPGCTITTSDLITPLSIGTQTTNRLTGNIIGLEFGTATEVIASYFKSGDFGSAALMDHKRNNNGIINGAIWAIVGDFTPKLKGDLLITSGSFAGTYAGAVQPLIVEILNNMTNSLVFQRDLKKLDFVSAIGLGLVPGVVGNTKFGYSQVLPITGGDIWPGDNFYVFPVDAGQDMEILSSDVGDTAVLVKVTGINAVDGTEITEEIALNGTTAVLLVNQYKAINRAFVSNDTEPIGEITIQGTGTPNSNVFAIIPVENKQTVQTPYMVPSDKVAIILTCTADINRSGNQDTSSVFSFEIKKPDGVSRTQLRFGTGKRGTSTSAVSEPNPIIVAPAGSQIRVKGVPDDPLDVSAWYSFYLFDKDLVPQSTLDKIAGN